MDLTFGEQVKIILSRKGMTIKQLAEIIEESTGKKMSRQNLTQRLGRDNFQEQDMRMIAGILGCPFHLNILDDSISTEEEFTQKEQNIINKNRKEKPVVEEPAVEEPVVEEPAAEENSEFEREVTIGELADTMQFAEAEEAIEQEVFGTSEEPEETASVEYEELAEEEYVEYEEPAETAYVEYEESAEEWDAEAIADEMLPEEDGEEEVSVEDILEEMEAIERESKERKKEKESRTVFEDGEKKSHGWRSYLPRIRKKAVEEVPEVQEPTVEEEEEMAPQPEEEILLDEVFQTETIDLDDELEEEEAQEEESAAEPEPVKKSGDEEEDTTIGDINPYTGHEYKSNSVRMHPSRIGYVQVYDRGEHKWTDMTEWAFLGYQERKKALLGKDYEPPIYLD